jgi:hypothetical protein
MATSCCGDSHLNSLDSAPSLPDGHDRVTRRIGRSPAARNERLHRSMVKTCELERKPVPAGAEPGECGWQDPAGKGED